MRVASTALRNALVEHAPRVLGRRTFAALAKRIGCAPALDLAETHACQRRLYPAARVFESDGFRRAVYAAYYGDGDANEVVPAPAVPSARSFVPYYRGTTSVLLFNFFRSNYNVRDPILYRYTVFQGDAAVFSQQLILGGNGVRLLPDPHGSAADLPAHGTLVIEAFNPRVATLARQLRFIVLYRDAPNGTISGTHSFPLPPGHLPALGQPSHRGFAPPEARFFYHSALANHVPLEHADGHGMLRRLRSREPFPGYGFLAGESAHGTPLTIWHDGPTTHALEPKQSRDAVGRPYSAFFVPDFALHAPYVLISRSQVGFLPRNVTISVARDGQAWSETRTVDIPADNTTIDMRAEFPALTGAVNCVLEFDRDAGDFPKMPSGMAHVYYRSPTGLGDQGHTHTTLGYADDPFRQYRSYRCRKFAPYLKDGALEFVYSLVNLKLGREPATDGSVRVRVYTDAGTEHLITLPLAPTGMTTIRPDDLFAGPLAEAKHAAVIQFEHDTTNFNGSWYAIDRRTGHVGTDHFTGG